MTPFTEVLAHLRGQRVLSRTEREELALRMETQVMALVEAGRGIIGDKPDKWGYGAAHNAMDDTKRAALRDALASFGENA